MGKNFFNVIAKSIIQGVGIKNISVIMRAEYASRKLPKVSYLKVIQSNFDTVVCEHVNSGTIALCKEMLQLVKKKREELNFQNSTAEIDILREREEAHWHLITTNYKDVKNTPKNISDCLYHILVEAYWIAQIITSSADKRFSYADANLSDNELCEESAVSQYNTNNLINLNDPNIFRKDFKIGFLLWELRASKYFVDDKIETLKGLLTEEKFNQIFNEHYDFSATRLDFFFKKELPFSCAAGIGYICGFYSYLKSHNAINEKRKMEVLQSLERFSPSIIENSEIFTALLDKVCTFSDASQCENILRYLNPSIYDNDDSLNTTVRNIVENGVFDCCSLSEVKSYLESLRESGRIIGNHLIEYVSNLLISKIDDGTMDDEFYEPRRRYNVWADDSLWSADLDYYEDIVMDLIETITSKNQTRNEAIKASKQLLAAAKKFAIERDIQIYERAYLEFNIATDEEYEMLRSEMEDD